MGPSLGRSEAERGLPPPCCPPSARRVTSTCAQSCMCRVPQLFQETALPVSSRRLWFGFLHLTLWMFIVSGDEGPISCGVCPQDPSGFLQDQATRIGLVAPALSVSSKLPTSRSPGGRRPQVCPRSRCWDELTVRLLAARPQQCSLAHRVSECAERVRRRGRGRGSHPSSPLVLRGLAHTILRHAPGTLSAEVNTTKPRACPRPALCRSDLGCFPDEPHLLPSAPRSSPRPPQGSSQLPTVQSKLGVEGSCTSGSIPRPAEDQASALFLPPPPGSPRASIRVPRAALWCPLRLSPAPSIFGAFAPRQEDRCDRAEGGSSVLSFTYPQARDVAPGVPDPPSVLS